MEMTAKRESAPSVKAKMAAGLQKKVGEFLSLHEKIR